MIPPTNTIPRATAISWFRRSRGRSVGGVKDLVIASYSLSSPRRLSGGLIVVVVVIYLGAPFEPEKFPQRDKTIYLNWRGGVQNRDYAHTGYPRLAAFTD